MCPRKENALETNEKAARSQRSAESVIGRTTTYRGIEFGFLRGTTVRIIAVIKNAAKPDSDSDEDGRYITDEEELSRAGGVTAEDRVEVAPWIEEEGRFSFVTSDPKASDLDGLVAPQQ